ncbi:protein kinase and PP2C-like domain-containing protein isoform X1 [Chenopodium quinoa]|uniref:protein kinase and PP2C-like domain-containing protein isoform X1 n=1 Tax=Chenopodium quinoa TaxID=63459 RepID=UPI000B788F32|nr:protein kinase and PP2C-like domain-containing protein isoform X1 [Chenopodium quinoa]
MGLKIIEPNTCIRGCCHSNSIPLHLPPSSFSLSSPIARGSESVVYEGSLDGRKVAIKKPILSTSDDIDRFHKQLQLLCKLDHPGLGRLIAAHAKPPNYMFFFEFYELGSLAHKLHVEEWVPSVDQALAITLELAETLQYLHNLGIVHRDVKPDNILLGENLSPHLADFGLAEYGKDLKKSSLLNWKSSGKPTGGFHKKNMVGTLIYMAPEILKKEIHTEKSDVYSFAVSVNELLAGVVPYTDVRAEAEAHTVLEMNYTEQKLIAAVVSDGLRPVLADSESGAPSSLLSLIQRCWDADPNSRPSFTVVVSELKSICDEVKNMVEKKNISVERTASQQFMGQTSNSKLYGESINWSNQGAEISKKIYLCVTSRTPASFDYPNDISSYNPVLSYGSFAACGQRETMEDTHFLNPWLCDQKNIYFFGVFDGHRGAAAAEFSAQALPKLLQSSHSSGASPAESLVRAFVETDIEFRSALDSHCKSKGLIKKDYHPGCTAIAAFLVKNKLYIANAGDCRAILCRVGHAVALSRDHVASCPEERDRIIKAGGVVKWQLDTWRVGAAALQVTRSIGDDDLKPAVTAEPEITETGLSLEDEYLVMASDGLWDVISNQEVVSIIRDTVKEPSMCSKRLATEAVQRGSKDNITVIVVFLRPVSTAERIY